LNFRGSRKDKADRSNAVNSYYVVGVAGACCNPGPGVAKPGDYLTSITTNTEIAVTSGQHIFIVTTVGGNVTDWTDVTVADVNIAAVWVSSLSSPDGVMKRRKSP